MSAIDVISAETATRPRLRARKTASLAKIWIDLDNSPHVPFFRPIIEKLRNLGYPVFVTARDAYQVCELLEYYQLSAEVVGRHSGKRRVSKVLGTLARAVALANMVRKEQPAIAVSHGSRACAVSSWMLGIPNIAMTDYEFVAKVPFAKPTWLMVPDVIPDDNLAIHGPRVMKYPGIKEDVYLSHFRPDGNFRTRLGLCGGDLLVTVRPPATEAHYHNPESETLLEAVFQRFSKEANVKMLILPRNKRQESEMRSQCSALLQSGKVLLLDNVEDGLNIIWNSDLVISGGGTMNREAAAMGVPVYSIFRGQIGAVDRYLVDTGRLVLIESENDVRAKIKIPNGAPRADKSRTAPNAALETIVENIVQILETHVSKTKA